MSQEELDAIRQAALNYVGGWYEANADRMSTSLHTELVKRRPMQDALQATNREQLLERARKRTSKATLAEIDVAVLDVYRNIATARIVSPDFVDYAHLVKLDGQWIIVNVLWDMK